MEIIKSIHIQQYVENNKKKAENEFPKIIKKLLINTVQNITKIDIPCGDDTIQTGFDGVINFNSVNKYLGDKPCKIEIGTDKNYLSKANKDIAKREADSRYNFVFFTPYRWNSRTVSKDKWITEKKKIYKWNDIIIIDAELLAEWINDDFLSIKYFLMKMNIESSNIFSLSEIEEELKMKTIKKINLNFFDYEEKNLENLLSNINKEKYNLVAPSFEEGVYVILFYLKKLNYTQDTIVVNDLETWNKLIKSNILHNVFLIPNFYRYEEIEIPNNNVTFIIYSEDEYFNDCDYKINQRTIGNLNKSLQLFYKCEDDSIDYDSIAKITRKSLGKYVALKRELFITPIKPEWYEEKNKELLLYLFYLNSFKDSEIEIFEQFDLEISNFKKYLKELSLKRDPYIIYYKNWKEFKVLNIYNVIEYLGSYIDEENIDKFCIIAKKILFDIEPRYLLENNNEYYIEDSSKRIYSKSLKIGVLKSLIITKLYLKKENRYLLYYKLDKIVEEYYSSLKTEKEIFNFAYIADKIAEFDFELYLNKIDSLIGNELFEKMFNYNDSLFSTNEYCNILTGIEKALYKHEYAFHAAYTLAKLCKIKNANYGNMVNRPEYSLSRVFIGWDNLTCLSKEEKIICLKEIIKKYNEIGKNLMIDILPSQNVTWTDFPTPDFDYYDEVVPIKYISEQKEIFEEYYTIYFENYVNTLEDVLPIFEELFFVDFNCFKLIKETIDKLLKNDNDYEKSKLKRLITKRINGYEKYNNSAWKLTQKQYTYLCYLRDSIHFSNQIYDYFDLYDFSYFEEDTDNINRRKQEMFKILKINFYDNICIMLDNSEDAKNLLGDIHEFFHKKNHDIEFIKLLIDKYNDKLIYYLYSVYKFETIEDIIRIYNDLELIDSLYRVKVLSEAGYNETLYSLVKDTKNEKIYWENLNYLRTKINSFVYKKCLFYNNFSFCLKYLGSESGKESEKCILLEKIIKCKYTPIGIEIYDINKIFKSFHHCTNLKFFEKFAKLEIYYGTILENNTFFLSKVSSNNPMIVAELVEIIYKDTDGKTNDISKKENVISNCYRILNNLKIDFSKNDCFKWCEQFLRILAKKKRNQVSYMVLGHLLAKSGADLKDGIVPIKNVRKIIEKYKSKELNRAFSIELYNQRGVHYIGIGEEENELYKRYLEYFNKLKLEYPETAKIMKSLAECYKSEANSLREEANYVEG